MNAIEMDIVIVSHGDQRWLPACFRSLESRTGGCRARITVVENGEEDPALEHLVTSGLQWHLVRAPNRGFAAGNNVGLKHTDARAVLFLNPDTELHGGTLAGLLNELDRNPDVGVVAVKQLTNDLRVYPSIRRFPSAARSLAQAFGSERWTRLGSRIGERELRMERYERRTPCDWTTGAVMLVRREALESAGNFDERFFLYSEETDLSRRITDAGWRSLHTPDVAFIHHAGKAGVNPRLEAQMAFARLQYARKHFSPSHRAAHLAVLLLHYLLRLLANLRRGGPASAAARQSLRVLIGLDPPPFAHLTPGGQDA